MLIVPANLHLVMPVVEPRKLSPGTWAFYRERGLEDQARAVLEAIDEEDKGRLHFALEYARVFNLDYEPRARQAEALAHAFIKMVSAVDAGPGNAPALARP